MTMKTYYLEEGVTPAEFAKDLEKSGMSALQARVFSLKLQEEGFVSREEVTRLVEWAGLWEMTVRLVEIGLIYLSFPAVATEPVFALTRHAPPGLIETLDEPLRSFYIEMQAAARTRANEQMN